MQHELVSDAQVLHLEGVATELALQAAQVALSVVCLDDLTDGKGLTLDIDLLPICSHGLDKILINSIAIFWLQIDLVFG